MHLATNLVLFVLCEEMNEFECAIYSSPLVGSLFWFDSICIDAWEEGKGLWLHAQIVWHYPLLVGYACTSEVVVVAHLTNNVTSHCHAGDNRPWFTMIEWNLMLKC